MQQKQSCFKCYCKLCPQDLTKWHSGLNSPCYCTFLYRAFSFECRKVIGFAFTTPRDWLKRFGPLSHPIRSKTKTNCVIASRALRQLHVITSIFKCSSTASVKSSVLGSLTTSYLTLLTLIWMKEIASLTVASPENLHMIQTKITVWYKILYERFVF